LQQCAVHAVRDHIVDERIRIRGMDTNLRVYPILDAVLGVSKTLEEGAWPRGRLVFVEPSEISGLPFLARFPDNERPSIQNFKHVRKLLQAVEFSPRQLVSDGRSLVGVSRDLVPGSAIVADFRGGHGFLFLGGTPVCSFSDGSFHSSTRRANLVHLEEALLETGLTHEDQHRLMQIVTRIVHAAGERKHGCAVVIDLGGRGLSMSGQYLDRPLDLRADENLDLALSLSKVDGALHLRSDLRLHGFACLMDGKAAPGEDRARGARYNSAVRFTSGHEEVIVVTVSSDRPVSVIQGGVNLTAICEWLPFYGCPSPPRIEDWVRDGQG
ncbi:MAG: DNA integrity scanning protein DisA nucleotide-binding domain protein, partial [Desulfovibrionaceae bacterium]|nr:DNA integrity scanning protein DisA nucleotide-binding domain protein [Desulfovibrionaceae bacterium]